MTRTSIGRVSAILAAAAAAALVLPAGTSLAAAHPRATITGDYIRTDLVSDNPRLTPTADANVVGPWGVSEFPDGPLWVSNEGHANTTLYAGADRTSAKLNPVPLVVSIPGGHPTGQAFNTTATTGSPAFTVTDGKVKAPAAFLFATLNGTIAGWAPNVGLAKGQQQSTVAEQATSVPGAVFTGLAQQGSRLYAADSAHHSIDVFGPDFTLLNLPGAFTDRAIPRGFSPFNVAAINGQILVTYAGPPGEPLGFVDVFTPDGVLVRRLIQSAFLNQPWGLALAPQTGFGPLDGALLVGNHGNGLINAFDPLTGRFLDTIRLTDGRPFVAPHLWGLIFGDGPAAAGGPPSAGNPNTLFFTEGASPGQHGLIGKIVAAEAA